MFPLVCGAAALLGANWSLGRWLRGAAPGEERAQAHLLGLFLPVLVGGITGWHLLEDLYLGGSHGLPPAPAVGSPVLWALGASAVLFVAGALSKALDHLRLDRRLRDCSQVDTEVREAQRLVDDLAQGNRAVRVRRLVTDKPTALLVGLFRPTLYLSSWYFKRLTEAGLRSVLAHELGHAKRRDNLLAAVGQGLVWATFWTPTIHAHLHGLKSEAEVAADGLAARLTGEPLELARTLVLSALAEAPDANSPACAFTGDGVEERVECLMHLHRRGAQPKETKGIHPVALWLLTAGAVYLLADILPHLLDGLAH